LWSEAFDSAQYEDGREVVDGDTDRLLNFGVNMFRAVEARRGALGSVSFREDPRAGAAARVLRILRDRWAICHETVACSEERDDAGAQPDYTGAEKC